MTVAICQHSDRWRWDDVDRRPIPPHHEGDEEVTAASKTTSMPRSFANQIIAQSYAVARSLALQTSSLARQIISAAARRNYPLLLMWHKNSSEHEVGQKRSRSNDAESLPSSSSSSSERPLKKARRIAVRILRRMKLIAPLFGQGNEADRRQMKRPRDEDTPEGKHL